MLRKAAKCDDETPDRSRPYPHCRGRRVVAGSSAGDVGLRPHNQDRASRSEGRAIGALSAPAEKWTDAAARARQIVRDSLLEQNLPGLSVAVGAGGDIVWAEGFGFADLESRYP